jgi:aminoglycoside/choline kinase family phosphotransferase
LAFDTEKLLWELNFFKQHTLLSYFKINLSGEAEKILNRFFLTLAQFLSSQPRYFTHRDYHSRNLIVQDEKIRVIDFQDARMGPCQYDLVSLVHDAYVTLPADVETRLIAEFRHEHKQRAKNFSDAQFDKTLDWMRLQRSLKAAGTFGYMAVERKNPNYLPHLPRVFDFAFEVLGKYLEFNETLKLLKEEILQKTSDKRRATIHESDDLGSRVWDAAAPINQ